MKQISFFIYVLSLIVVIGCQRKQNNDTDQLGAEVQIWVNSYFVDCWRNGQATCMQIQESAIIIDSLWEDYYSGINKFEYIPGNLYKLKVIAHDADPNRAVGDYTGKAIRYTLLEILEKTPDPRLRIQDIWSLQSINGVENEIGLDSRRPSIDFNITNRTFMGSGNCNNFSGTIEQISGTMLELDNIGSTRMTCPDINLEAKFFEALENTRTYQIENVMLTLLDSVDNELLVFKKVD